MKSATDLHAERSASEKDVLHGLFKHKWKILLTSLLVSGTVAWAASEDLPDPTFTSHAKFMIRYVVERQDKPNEPTKMTKAPEVDSVLKTEMAFLKSYDLAREVAKAIGPERLLSEPAAADPEVRAAERIASGLEVVIRPGSDVIDLRYRDRSPELVQRLQSLDAYGREYGEEEGVRSSIGGKEDAGLIAQVDQARSTLQETEEEISQLKEQADTLRDEGEKTSDLDVKL